METQGIEKHNKIEIFGNLRKHLVTVEEFAEFVSGDGGEITVSIDDVNGVTDIGLSLNKATSQSEARTAIGAGTSNLTIGSTATTAKAGNYTPPNVTTSVNGLMLSADKSKLDGIMTSATANDTDTNLKNRANHTGTQPFTTLSGTASVAQIPPLDANKTTSGTFALARIPTGNTSTTVALGDHTHAGLVTPTTAPVITIPDPTDTASVQGAFDDLINALKASGVLV